MQMRTRVQKRARKLERVVLVFAIVLRLATEPALYTLAGTSIHNLTTDPKAASLFSYLYSGTVYTYESRQKHGGTVTVSYPKQQQSVQTQAKQDEPKLQFTAAEAASIRIIGSCTYSYDTAALLAAPLKTNFSLQGPQILIVHTHTTEAYSESVSEGYQSTDPAKNVIAVGNAMAEVFESFGIQTLHETGLNDVYGYTDAYERMDEVIADYLTCYPSIRMVIDVHRDAFEDSSGEPAGPVVYENGESCAKVMLVMGTDEGGLYHPNWQDNLSCALKIQSMLQNEYPSLCRDLLLRQSRYNQHRTPCSMLVEVGASGNTLPQAEASARLFAETVSRLILANTQ